MYHTYHWLVLIRSTQVNAIHSQNLYLFLLYYSIMVISQYISVKRSNHGLGTCESANFKPHIEFEQKCNIKALSLSLVLFYLRKSQNGQLRNLTRHTVTELIFVSLTGWKTRRPCTLWKLTELTKPHQS
jgi:hypothetical protein